MKAASLHEIRQRLKDLSREELSTIVASLARYKKDNKEYLSYLLFDAHDPRSYVAEVKQEMTNWFNEINHDNVYYIKKGVRKVLRLMNKQIRYIDTAESECELRIAFLRLMKEHRIPVGRHPVIRNMYLLEEKKTRKAIDQLHEDLRHDYLPDLEAALI